MLIGNNFESFFSPSFHVLEVNVLLTLILGCLVKFRVTTKKKHHNSGSFVVAKDQKSILSRWKDNQTFVSYTEKKTKPTSCWLIWKIQNGLNLFVIYF